MHNVVIVAKALVMVLVCATAQPALADAKDEFKKGCESGTRPGSFVENVDNVQCNTSGGTTITCDKGITHCSVSAEIVKPFKPTKANLNEYMTRTPRVSGWKVVVPTKDKADQPKSKTDTK